MKQEIEIEFKNLLEKKEFHDLVEAFQLSDSFFSQTNHYFDTPSFLLKKHGCALRIRVKEAMYTLTLKQPHIVGLLETHESLTKEEAEQLLHSTCTLPNSIASLLENAQIPVAELRYLGSLTTNRAEITYKSGLLVLDHSIYAGQEDYEIEYEVKDEQIGKEEFLQLLQTYNIPTRQTDNKIKRFFNIMFK